MEHAIVYTIKVLIFFFLKETVRTTAYIFTIDLFQHTLSLSLNHNKRITQLVQKAKDAKLSTLSH